MNKGHIEKFSSLGILFFYDAGTSLSTVIRRVFTLSNMKAGQMAGFHVVRVERIELSPHPWQGRVLPLNDTRDGINIH